MATSPEKRMRVLPSLRIGESLENALMRLAARDERTLSGYIVRVLENTVLATYRVWTWTAKCSKTPMRCTPGSRVTDT